MRVAVIGGTRFVGPAAVRALVADGHEVVVAHSGAHEHPDVERVEHVHGVREELLGAGGPVERLRPDVLVDSFPGGATAAAARQLANCAARAGAGQIVAISSIDVYRHCVQAGLGDGTGAVALPDEPIPLGETATLRDAPYPGGSDAHDNVAMEAALHDAGRVAALRPGAIYGPADGVRERVLVERVRRGERRLPLPDGGTQLFHRVAVERVGGAVAAAVARAPAGFWACNVVDPTDHSYASLAAAVGALLDWEWEPERVPFDDEEHPWRTAHPVLCSDRRLVEVLGVVEPDPQEALAATVRWLWEHP